MMINNKQTNKNKQTALKAGVLAMLFVFGAAQLAAAQDLLAMLNRSSVAVSSYDLDPTDTNTVNNATKAADKTPVFDIMGGGVSMEESLVMDFTAKKKMDVSATVSLTSEEARPKAGWNAFQKYMSTVAISPDGKCGNVKLSFTVDANGAINDCKVVAGLSEAADNKAVELIKNGPSWVNATDTKAVSVTINFHRLHADQPDFL
ncbi:MAG: hypothetical protein EOP47_11095 [Sphingobacteriaceae bacterium]|nr:MAG: hypothetical protein EOP47_11095 [Sphingobacteriaceae bacterium]